MNDMEIFDNILSQAIAVYMNEWLFSDEFKEDKFNKSKSFEKKMSKMIKSQHNIYHKLTLTRVRKFLCIAAIIIALFLSSLSVGAVRVFIANFFVNHFSTHDKLSANTEEGSYPTELEELYELGYIPDGYELADESILDNSATYVYVSGEVPLIFEQTTKDMFSFGIDNEFTTKTTEVHNRQEYYVNEHNDGSFTFIWDNGEYIFDLTAYLPKEAVFNLCNSLKIK